MTHPPWETYVARLCLDEWSLDPTSVIKVMRDIEVLVACRDLTDSSVAVVLRMAGLSHAEAKSFAPRICVTIRSALTPRSGTSS